MKKSVIFFTLFLITLFSYGQRKITDEISANISNRLEIVSSGFKDSVSIYTFAIKIDIEKQGNKQIVKSILLNDSIGYKMFKDLNVLKEIDYRQLMDNKSNIQIIVPIAIIVANHPNRTTSPAIGVENLQMAIKKLFFNPATRMPGDYIYLAPLINYIDANIYD